MKKGLTQNIEYVRIVGDERRRGERLKDVSRHWQEEKECYALVSPHDDDVILGAGLFMQLAQREGIPIHVIIVTDGSMGYCSEREKETISETRKRETYECYQSLGIPEENIHWLGFPDSGLNAYRGRRVARSSDRGQIAGYTGLQNAFTYVMRKIRPTQCFVPTCNDLHPDHKITYEELLISLFHAGGPIWPELGSPIERTPYVHEMAIYCDFPEPPTLRISTPDEFLDRKLAAIGAFKSQEQITSLIEGVRASGPFEYIRSLNFHLYQPRKYYDTFEKKHYISFVR